MERRKREKDWSRSCWERPLSDRMAIPIRIRVHPLAIRRLIMIPAPGHPSSHTSANRRSFPLPTTVPSCPFPSNSLPRHLQINLRTQRPILSLPVSCSHAISPPPLIFFLSADGSPPGRLQLSPHQHHHLRQQPQRPHRKSQTRRSDAGHNSSRRRPCRLAYHCWSVRPPRTPPIQPKSHIPDSFPL